MMGSWSKVGGTVFYSAYYSVEIDRTSWEMRFKEESSFMSVFHSLLGKESDLLVLEKREGLSPYSPEGFATRLAMITVNSTPSSLTLGSFKER